MAPLSFFFCFFFFFTLVTGPRRSLDSKLSDEESMSLKYGGGLVFEVTEAGSYLRLIAWLPRRARPTFYEPQRRARLGNPTRLRTAQQPPVTLKKVHGRVCHTSCPTLRNLTETATETPTSEPRAPKASEKGPTTSARFASCTLNRPPQFLTDNPGVPRS